MNRFFAVLVTTIAILGGCVLYAAADGINIQLNGNYLPLSGGTMTGAIRGGQSVTFGNATCIPWGDGEHLTHIYGNNIDWGTVPAAQGGAGSNNGILKANGTGIVSTATPGTDYLTPTGSGASLTGITASQVGAKSQSAFGIYSGNQALNISGLLADDNTYGSYVSVKHFGAKGDGTTDDTNAIFEGVTSCIHNNKVLYIPAGTYKMTYDVRGIIPDSSPYVGFTMLGAGRTKTIFKYSGVGAPTLFHFDCNNPNGGGLYVHLAHFRIDLTGAPAGTSGIQFVGIWRSVIDDLKIIRDALTPKSGFGIKIATDPTYGMGAFDDKIYNCDIEGFDTAIDAEGTNLTTNTVTNLSVIDNFIINNNFGVKLIFAEGALLAGNEIGQNSKDNVNLTACDGVHIEGGTIEAAGHWGVNMDQDSGGLGLNQDGTVTKNVYIDTPIFNNISGDVNWNHNREPYYVLTDAANITLNANIANVFWITPYQNETYAVVGGTPGQMITVFVYTSTNTTSYTLTFDGNYFNSQGPLSTGTTAAKMFTVNFINRGNNGWTEISRTGPM